MFLCINKEICGYRLIYGFDYCENFFLINTSSRDNRVVSKENQLIASGKANKPDLRFIQGKSW